MAKVSVLQENCRSRAAGLTLISNAALNTLGEVSEFDRPKEVGKLKLSYLEQSVSQWITGPMR